MSSHIEIGDIVLKQKVHSVHIESSRRTIADEAIIQLPNISAILEKKGKRIKAGDPVKIMLGYDENFKTEFEGYVSKTHPRYPFTVEAQDEAWQIKQQQVSGSWPEIKLADLIKHIVPGADVYACPDITLHNFPLDPVSKYLALEEIKKAYHIDIYFRKGKLYAGLAYNEKNLAVVKYHFQENLSSTGNNLTFNDKDVLKIQVVATSIDSKNNVITSTAGIDGGELRTLNYYNKTQTELDALAKEQLEKLNFDGLSGTFMGFGVPFASHSHKASLTNKRLPELSGDYFIDTVVTDYSISGFKRMITPGKRA